MEVLLRHGAALNRIEGSVGSALHAAAIGGNLRAFLHLLGKGAKMHGSVIAAATFGKERREISFVGRSKHREIVQFCLENGAYWDESIAALARIRGFKWGDLKSETRAYLITRVMAESQKIYHGFWCMAHHGTRCPV